MSVISDGLLWCLNYPEEIKDKNGYDFKACRKTGLKEFRSRKHGLYRSLSASAFIAGIQMNADADHGFVMKE